MAVIGQALEAGNAEREGDEVVVVVKDTGLGIPPELLPSVFEMFTQVDRKLERSQSGLGIGLTLVKRLVEMDGGTVRARSEGPNRGSEFVVRLPILDFGFSILDFGKEPGPEATSAGTLSDNPKSKIENPKSKRVLVVDDNRDAATSLADLLELTGHETRTAYDGQEAVEAAAKFRPDVVLLDIGLPKQNGYEAAREIREQPWGKKMVLVALTGWGQDEDRQKSEAAGFNSHMVKPVEYDALTQLLADL